VRIQTVLTAAWQPFLGAGTCDQARPASGPADHRDGVRGVRRQRHGKRCGAQAPGSALCKNDAADHAAAASFGWLALVAALTNLSLSQRDQAFTRVDELLAEYSRYTDKNAKQNTEVMAGVLQVFSKMDSLV